MDINLTAAARNYRLFAKPALITTIGVVGALLIVPDGPPTTQVEMLLARFQEWVFLGFSAMALIGSAWAIYRGWLEWRWERGELDGDCKCCAGPVENRTGRWGDYCRCMICGSTQKGHH